MYIALMVLMLFLSLIGMTVMHYSVVWGILACLCAITLTVLYLVLFKKFPPALKNGIMCGGFALCLLFFALMKPQNSKYQLTGYMEDMIKVEKMINNNDKKAEKTLNKLKDKYGQTDSIMGLYAILCLNDEDLEGAYAYMNQYSNRSSREYYQRMEYLYLLDSSRDTSGYLYGLYEEAAEKHLDWGYMQRMAGVANFEKKYYDKAEYYLLSAVALDDQDAMAYYYLGAVYFEKGHFDDCKKYFYKALESGVSDEVQSWIAWYVERME